MPDFGVLGFVNLNLSNATNSEKSFQSLLV